MIDHWFIGPMGVTNFGPGTLCQAIVGNPGPICGKAYREHVGGDHDEEELNHLWMRAHIIAGHPQTVFPATNVLMEFVTLLRETSRSGVVN